MENIRIICPSGLLVPYVWQYWFLSVKTTEMGSQRIVPSGCTALVFHRGERVFSSLRSQDEQPRSYLSGSVRHYSDLFYGNCLDVVIVLFRPSGYRAFCKGPVSEWSGGNTGIEWLGDPLLCRLEEELMRQTDCRLCVNRIEQYLLQRFCDSSRGNLRRMEAVMQAVNDGESHISGLARAACLGYKQFLRMFTDCVGITPGDFLRIVRFRKAFRRIQFCPGIQLDELAYDSGYYDKSHLIKEFRRFTGYTPGEFLVVSDPYTEGLSLFHTFFIHGKKNPY